MSNPDRLTGMRRAVLRSALVGVAACALVGVIASVLPGHAWVTSVVDATGPREVVDRDPAGSPLVIVTLVAMIGVAGFALALVRRDVTVFVAGVLTVLAIPLLVWMGFTDDRVIDAAGRRLPPAAVLDACLGSLVAAGPMLAILGAVLFGLERRVRTSPVPVARTAG